MAVTPKEYQKMVDKATPPSKALTGIPAAFLVGGLICTLGELFSAGYVWARLYRKGRFADGVGDADFFDGIVYRTGYL